MKSYKEYLLETRDFPISKKTPSKTIKGYKLFKVKNSSKGKLFPLYVDAAVPVPIGKWVDATEGKVGKKEGKVASKLGDLAYRPGWHSGTSPVATHIGVGGKPPKYRANDTVWAEVEIPADVDWQEEANNRAERLKKDSKTTGLKKGDINPKTAHITDQIPINGYYKYKTNPNMTGEWIISGAIKVNKVLTDEEVEKINNSFGVKDLPRKEPLDISKYGF